VGTTVNIVLPLTLAIIPSLIVRVANCRFAIPQASISELVRVKPSELAAKIQRVQHAQLFRLRGHLIPLVHLCDALGLGAAPAGQAEGRARNIIVVETGQLRYGVVVDGLYDSEEIVVKPLGRHMRNCQCLAGATILGDGTVALILDLTGLAAHCRLRLPDEDELQRDNETAQNGSEELQTLLLFRNAPSERFGIPMEAIDRVERIRQDQLDTVGGRWVLQYRGASLPLLRLEDLIAARPAPAAPKLYVAVFRTSGRELGLIVPELIDIRRVPVQVDTLTFRQPGVAGSLVVEGAAIRLLDLFELARAARPDWFPPRACRRGDTGRPHLATDPAGGRFDS
jgi:two-component system chemotaxis sensor kinase CheA